MSESTKQEKSSKVERKVVKASSLFWGLLFVLVGGLILAENLGWTNIHWANVWSLWPMFIIAIGLSILSVRGIIWRMVVWLLVLASIVFVGLVAVGYVDFSSQIRNTSTVASINDQDIKSAVIRVKAGAGNLVVNSKDHKEMVKASLDSNIAELKQNVSYDGTVENVDLEMSTLRQGWIGGIRNNLEVSINREIPVSFEMSFGAAEADIDLREAKVTDINLKSGASSTILIVGDKEKTVDIEIDSGASSTIVRVPKNSGVRLKLEGGIIDKNLADLTEKNSDTYESSDYSTSKNTVNITAKIGVASFKIERY